MEGWRRGGREGGREGWSEGADVGSHENNEDVFVGAHGKKKKARQ